MKCVCGGGGGGGLQTIGGQVKFYPYKKRGDVFSHAEVGAQQVLR